MLTTIEMILFVLLAIASVVVSYITFGRMFRIILQGHGKIQIDDWWAFFRDGAIGLITQGGIIHRRRLTSLFHYAVAWAFIFYFLVNAVDVLEAYLAGFVFLGDTFIGGVYRLLADLLTVAGFIGVLYFIIRRFLTGDTQLRVRDNVTLIPKALKGIPRDSLLVAIFILIHLGFRFLGQSFLVSLDGNDAWQPFANLVANLWTSLSLEWREIGWHASWWIALGAIFMFLPYFPYTKHAHLFMGPLNIGSRPRRTSLGAIPSLDFEDESVEQFGVARLTDLPQTQILDAFACIMCNRCQEACPAYATGKELSPAAIEINKRYYIRENMVSLAEDKTDSLLLLEYAISESALWACTTCGACVEVCPVGNEPMFDIVNIRQNQVLMESSFPHELKSAFNGMERLANPWGLAEDRLGWTKSLHFNVPTVEENPDFDVLFWVGCAGAFDPNAQAIAQATATVLHAAAINFAVLGNDETCTGDSARRAGNEYLYYELAMGNIETLNSLGIAEKQIVTSCPHCFHTLGKEYGELGGNYTVMHHTQLISDLIGKGKLTLKNGVLEETTFHDPCYLGRHNDVFDAPRNSLAKAGRQLLEMDRSREDSFCCGAGGAQMWKEEEPGNQGVNVNRYEEAVSTGASTLATGCPFCAIMMNDANTEAGGKMVVKDVAQVIAEAID